MRLKLTLLFPSDTSVSPKSLRDAQIPLGLAVAQALSTGAMYLKVSDVSILMTPYEPSFCVLPQAVAIEIETFGHPTLKTTLTKEAVLELKRTLGSILVAAGFPINWMKPLLSLNYVDPEGHYV